MENKKDNKVKSIARAQTNTVLNIHMSAGFSNSFS